jgi:hypothetical protein
MPGESSSASLKRAAAGGELDPTTVQRQMSPNCDDCARGTHPSWKRSHGWVYTGTSGEIRGIDKTTTSRTTSPALDPTDLRGGGMRVRGFAKPSAIDRLLARPFATCGVSITLAEGKRRRAIRHLRWATRPGANLRSQLANQGCCSTTSAIAVAASSWPRTFQCPSST